MKKLKYLLFSVICLFSFSIVFAADEVVIKSITPVYDEESSIIVSNENDNYNVTFNEKEQNVKYKVVIENTLNYELKVSNIDLATPTASYLIYEIDGIAKDDILKSKEKKELVISLSTTEKDKETSDFDEELLTTIGFEQNVKNPNTGSFVNIFIVAFGIVVICFLVLKNNKVSSYVAILVICFSIMPVIKAVSTIELQIKLHAKYETPSPVSIVSGDGTKVGDEIKIGEEHFYVISNDGTNVSLLAKYNLEVGKRYTKEFGSWQLVEIDNASGLQNEKALGFVSGATEYYGVLPFSSTNYWYSNGLKSEYGTSYPEYVYDDNASIKTYVENYAVYLEGLGLTIEEARLIKQEELVGLGCDASKFTCTTSQYDWVYTTTYWSGSADNNYGLSRVISSGTFFNTNYNYDLNNGVRPVIVISSSEI